jgi:hypothetical protein
MIRFLTHPFLLQKISSIFFLSLLIFFQYSKSLSYLHCVIENAINTGSAYCDCEKQNKDNADNAQSSSTQKASFKDKTPENLFTYGKQIMPNDYRIENRSIISTNNISQLSTGFHSSIFQPPQSIIICCFKIFDAQIYL